ncbi:MAG: hypothetical protein AAFV07_01645 [Bacteroidota bacterium]
MKHLLSVLVLLLGTNIVWAQAPRIHVFVALCDNVNQGIVPVPASLGNGQDPSRNLYWGAGYGVKTHFKRQKNWQSLSVDSSQNPLILDRVAFRHGPSGGLMVAEAFDGAHMRETLEAYLLAASGATYDTICVNGDKLAFGSGADLVAFVGHNGLMEVWPSGDFRARDSAARKAIMLACYSKPYFESYMDTTGAQPLLWSTHLMAPEAYVLADALNAWLGDKPPAAVADAAAAAYHRYQKCGIRAARRLLVSGDE